MSFIQEFQEVSNFSGGSASGSFEFSSSGVTSLSGAYASSGSAAAAAGGGSVNQIAQDLLQFSRNTGSFLATTGSAAAASFGGSAVSASAAAAGGVSVFVSQIENAILASTNPINVNETEEITVLGNRGVWANKAEVLNWKGVIPIEQYVINEDSNPEVITKRVREQLEYVQELAIRYLRPPTPPAPGEIVIKQEGNTLTPPAPPLVIRQVPARASTPEPLVVREAPPQPPNPVGRKLITIGGKRLPPPPRKVVIERLAPLPSKPQSVIIERWLPYSQAKRRVIFQKPDAADPIVVKPRNIVVQWEAPQVVIKKDFKYLGVIRANPAEYVSKFGATLKLSKDLPQFVLDVKTPEGLVLAADYKQSAFYELEGDVAALRLVDLDREGLAEYRSYLAKLGFSGSSGSIEISGASAYSSSSSSVSAIIEEIFRSIDVNSSGSISLEEAERILLKLNSRLGRRYGENEVRAFFQALDADRSGSIDLQEFRRAFISL